MVGDLPGLMFYDGPALVYESGDGLDVQRKVLDRIPSQLAGLRLQLEEIEDAEKEDSMRLLGEVIEDSRDQPQQREEPGKNRQQNQRISPSRHLGGRGGRTPGSSVSALP
jgi:hypothetical protein